MSTSTLTQDQEALSVSAVSRRIDRFDAVFDHQNLVANAGLILAGTLMCRLGMEALVNKWVRTGSPNAGRKVLTLVSAMLAGATHIDHVDVLRAGATQRVLPFTVLAPSTIGTFLRSFTFGHVRQLDAVLSRALSRAWNLGAGPGPEPLVIDLDSTICEVHSRAKQGAAHGYTKVLGYHPLLATRAGTGEILMARMRKGSAGSARGAIGFVNELVSTVRQAGATGPMTIRADAGFWTWKLIDRLNHHGIKWSITIKQLPPVHEAILAIPEEAWVTIDYPFRGEAQVAETVYETGGHRPSRPRRSVRLIVRRTRLVDPVQQKLWPDWRHHAFITNTDHDTVEADLFHRNHAVVELAIRDIKQGGGIEHFPSGHYAANAAWLACAVLAHNIGHWITIIAGNNPVTSRTRRTQLIAVAAAVVNRSGRPTLRFPTQWPWETQFVNTLKTLRGLPAPSG